jgi:hypothetical protein
MGNRHFVSAGINTTRGRGRALLSLLLAAALLAPAFGMAGAAPARLQVPQAPDAPTITRVSSSTLGLAGSAYDLTMAPTNTRIAFPADRDTDGINQLISMDANSIFFAQALIFGVPTQNPTADYLGVTFTPNGSRVVLLTDARTEGVFELFSCATNTNGANMLSSNLTAGGNVLDFVITPDSSRVIYRADQDADEVFELYSAPVDGSSPAVKISGSLVSGGDVNNIAGSCNGCYAATSQGGGTLVFQADKDLDGVFELYATSFTGGTITKLHASYGGSEDASSLRLNPNGSRVVFRTNQDVDTDLELYSVNLDGSGLSQVNATLVANGDVDQYALSADNTTVVYTADQTTDGVSELFSAPISGGSSATKISGAISGSEDVQDFRISPTSTRVVFRADQDTDGKNELFTTPIGSAGSSKLEPSGGLPADADVTSNYAISPDGNRVLFLADKTFPLDDAEQLFSAPIDDSAAAVELSTISAATREVSDFRISPNSVHVIWRADQDADNDFELYLKPIAGGAQVQLNGTLPVNGDVTSDFGFTGDSARIVYLSDELSEGNVAVMRVDPDGNGRLRISPDLANREAKEFLVAPDATRVVYIADQETDNIDQLYSVGSNGSGLVKISGTLATNEEVGLFDTVITSDGSKVLFKIISSVTFTGKLMVNGITSAAEPTQLSAPTHNVEDFQYSHSANRALYPAFVTASGVTQYRLYSAPVTGGGVTQISPASANPTMVGLYTQSPDGSRVVFTISTPISPGSPTRYRELWSAPVDGSSPAVRLHSALPPERSVDSFVVSPSGTQVVFTGDLTNDGFIDVYRVPFDGSAAPLRIWSAAASTDFPLLGPISPDGQTALILQTTGDDRLFAANLENPVANSAYPLTASLSGGSLTLSAVEVNAFSSWAIFRTLQSGLYSIYRVPLNGASQPQVVVSAGTGFPKARFSPDGARILYELDPSGSSTPNEVYMALLSGAPAVKLNPALPAGADARIPESLFTGQALSPGGERVLITADSTIDGRDDLYYASTGGTIFSPVSAIPLAGATVSSAYFSGFDNRIFYMAEQNHPGVNEIFVSTDSRANQSINTPGSINDTYFRSMPVSLSGLANATSGLPVTYLSAAPQVCQVSGTTVSAVGIGMCTIVIVQDGNASFNPAAYQEESFLVLRDISMPLVVKNAGAP